MATDYRSVPGVYTGNTFQTRNIHRDLSKRQYFPSMAIIDSTLTRDIGSTPVDLLRAGLILGKITTGGKYRNSIIGLTSGAISAATVTSVTVAAATATEFARLIAIAGGNVSARIFGPPSAAGTNAATSITVTAASGTTLTVSSVTLPAYVDKSLIQPVDGSQTPVTVISEAAGIDVNAIDGSNIDQMVGRFLSAADVYSNMIIAGDTDITGLDASLKTWIKQQLNGGGTHTRGNWTFDDEVP